MSRLKIKSKNTLLLEQRNMESLRNSNEEFEKEMKSKITEFLIKTNIIDSINTNNCKDGNDTEILNEVIKTDKEMKKYSHYKKTIDQRTSELNKSFDLENDDPEMKSKNKSKIKRITSKMEKNNKKKKSKNFVKRSSKEINRSIDKNKKKQKKSRGGLVESLSHLNKK